MTRLLSTRPLSASLKALAVESGIVIDDIAFITTTPIRDEKLTTKIRDLSRLPLTIVFTSMNAVEAIAGHLWGSPLSGQAYSWKIFSIGAATRELVEKHFGKDVIAGVAPSATELAEEILKSPSVNEIFFFCGDQRRDELPEKLKKQGVTVHEIVVYRTEKRPHKMEEIYDGVIFFSPSAVHSFFSVNEVPSATVLFAIGRTTAAVIREYSANTVISAEAPEKEALIKQVIAYFQTRL